MVSSHPLETIHLGYSRRRVTCKLIIGLGFGHLDKLIQKVKYKKNETENSIWKIWNYFFHLYIVVGIDKNVMKKLFF